MTTADVKRRVKHIADLAGDPEAAHSEEDRLYVDVLRAIATGEISNDPASLAKAALKADDLDFARWYA